jgi:hypothetical protein
VTEPIDDELETEDEDETEADDEGSDIGARYDQGLLNAAEVQVGDTTVGYQLSPRVFDSTAPDFEARLSAFLAESKSMHSTDIIERSIQEMVVVGTKLVVLYYEKGISRE